MRKVSLMIAAGVICLASSCEQELLSDVSYSVSLSSENTYKAGDPVRFNFEGDVDYVLFYSGENGYQYQYRDRTSVPFEDIDSIKLDMKIQPRFGIAGGMDIYVSKDFQYCFKGDDAQADKAAMKAMADAGMQGWTKLEWEEGKSGVWAEYSFNLTDYAENFAIAFHWHPTTSGWTVSQRTYWMNGTLSVNMKGVNPSSKTLRDLEVQTVAMNDELDPYHKNKSNGSVVFNNSAAQYVFQGCSASEKDYELDAWVVSRPMSLNSVSRDQGEVIKNMTNILSRYEYTFDEPGTYYCTFVGINETVQGRSEQVRKVRVTVTD